MSLNNKVLFFPEIDSLRALAVVMTLGAHFLPENGFWHIPFLHYGVDLFFAISGFLITNILLKSKEEIPKLKKRIIIKNFFIRRILRLFPIYYCFILFFFFSKHLFNLQIWKDEYNLYFFTYLQNLYFFKSIHFDSQFLHLWSLGVEEQFYLIWPFIVLYIPFNKLKWVLLFMIAISIFIRGIFSDIFMIEVLPVSHFHTLGGGALLAYFFHSEKDRFLTFLNKKRFILCFFSLTILIGLLATSPFSSKMKISVVECFVALTGVLFVLNSIYGWPVFIRAISRNKVVLHIGKVSYGIYLFHLPLPALMAVLVNKTGIGIPFNFHPLIPMVIYFLLSYGLASISYRIIELPFLKLKAHFK